MGTLGGGDPELKVACLGHELSWAGMDPSAGSPQCRSAVKGHIED